MLGFKWEKDNFWWEMLRFDELGLPEEWNFIIPDKLTHLIQTFGLVWFFSKYMKRDYAALLGWGIMMGPWELYWDGMTRHGASWKDMIANTLGAALCWWWLGEEKIGQLDD